MQNQLRAERRFGQRFFQKRVALVGAAVDDENRINRHPEAPPDGLVDPVASMSLISSSSQERQWSRERAAASALPVGACGMFAPNGAKVPCLRRTTSNESLKG